MVDEQPTDVILDQQDPVPAIQAPVDEDQPNYPMPLVAVPDFEPPTWDTLSDMAGLGLTKHWPCISQNPKVGSTQWGLVIHTLLPDSPGNCWQVVFILHRCTLLHAKG
jgi:hypothetical protein